MWDLYSEARQAQEDRSGGAGAQGGVQHAGPTQATQGSGRVGMFALGVLSRLLTVLRLMYSVRVSLMLCQECRPRCYAQLLVSYGLYTAHCDQCQDEIHNIKQNQALACKLLSSIEEAPSSLQLCSLRFDSCSLHSILPCCSTCCPGQHFHAQNCCLLVADNV